MPSAASTDLESFVRQLQPAQMAELLIELSRELNPVRQRLLRLQLAEDPKRLAAGFRKSLTAWRRATRFLAYRDAREFGLELEAWLGQVERELMPRHPAAALALAESFIESDAVFFDRADDSDGVIGDAVRAGCRLWLRAAARCESPPEEWPARLDAPASADQYGAREGLYRYADVTTRRRRRKGNSYPSCVERARACANVRPGLRQPCDVAVLRSILSLNRTRHCWFSRRFVAP